MLAKLDARLKPAVESSLQKRVQSLAEPDIAAIPSSNPSKVRRHANALLSCMRGRILLPYARLHVKQVAVQELGFDGNVDALLVGARRRSNQRMQACRQPRWLCKLRRAPSSFSNR